VISHAQNYLAYKETYLLIIDANIRHALFLGEVAAVMAPRDEAGRGLPIRIRPLELTQQPVAALDG
jgi:hypothetical protein